MSQDAKSQIIPRQRWPIPDRGYNHSGRPLTAVATVSTYMVKRRGPPSQNWRTFLRNHREAIAAIDLCQFRPFTSSACCLHRYRPRTPADAVVRGDPASDRPRSGWRSRSSRPLRGRQHRPTWCATMMAHTARFSGAGFGRWGSETDQYRPARPGRTRMRNG